MLQMEEEKKKMEEDLMRQKELIDENWRNVEEYLRKKNKKIKYKYAFG